MDEHTYLAEDARDRRAALAFAQAYVYGVQGRQEFEWPPLADEAYRWLQRRDSLRAVSIQLIAGEPRNEEGTPAMSAVIDLSDIQEIPFTLGGLDAKDASVPAPADTWVWSLADPDGTGATFTPSADTTSCVVAAGSPDTTGVLTLTVTGQNTGLTGSQAIDVVASAATAIALVAGTASAEAGE
jgi:hypothetical protein